MYIKADKSYIFGGEIQKSSGVSEDSYKFCENVLFTMNSNILKKINEKDWLSSTRKSVK
jgi:hypothetical protein